MRNVRWLVALWVLPLVWCKFELSITQENITEKPAQGAPGIFDLREDPARRLEYTYFDPGGRIVPRASQVTTETFQVAEPILAENGLRLRGQSSPGGPDPKAPCFRRLMVHSFENSYYKPFISSFPAPVRVDLKTSSDCKQEGTNRQHAILIASLLSLRRRWAGLSLTALA